MNAPVVIGNCTLYLGDCREILPQLGRFDACVTDPPYGLGENDRKVASRGTSSAKWKRAKATDYGSFDWDRDPVDAGLMAQVLSCARWQIIFGGNYYHMAPASCWLVWDKLNTGDFADCELAWTNLPGAVRRIRYLWNGFARANGEPRGDHPTQKPLGVMEWCLARLPDSANSIVDPFMGSGTTGVAVIRRGGAFTGIERNPRYFEAACRRISEAVADRVSQPDLIKRSSEPPAPQGALDL